MKIFDEHRCMLTSYYVITNQVSYEQLANRDDFTLIFNPREKIDPIIHDTYDVLIDYFEDLEDYEKCAELLEYKEIALKNSELAWPLDQGLYDE